MKIKDIQSAKIEISKKKIHFCIFFSAGFREILGLRVAKSFSEKGPSAERMGMAEGGKRFRSPRRERETKRGHMFCVVRAVERMLLTQCSLRVCRSSLSQDPPLCSFPPSAAELHELFLDGEISFCPPPFPISVQFHSTSRSSEFSVIIIHYVARIAKPSFTAATPRFFIVLPTPFPGLSTKKKCSQDTSLVA